MSRGVQAFKQTDVSKAIKGARNAGLVVARCEIDSSGKIIVVAVGQPATPHQDGVASA